MAGPTHTHKPAPPVEERPPARIHILLAQEVPVGLVFRRGPSKQVCAIGWNRANDTFTVGQWLKGRIYERRSDLSPDGRYLIYFALKGKPGTDQSTSYTAMSKTPFLKPIGLWEKADSQHGGGLFLNRTTYWINDERSHKAVTTPRDLRKVPHYRGENSFGSECAGVYFLRLQRDGWTLKETPTESEGGSVAVFEKPAGAGWVLRKTAHVTPLNSPDAHEFVHTSAGTRIDLPDWEWADIDRNRAVWSTAGKLFAAQIGEKGPAEQKQLFDFNPLRFVVRTAPY